MNKKILFCFVSLVLGGHYLGMHAGIGAQYNIDDTVKDLIAQQKMQEDTLKQSSPSASPKSILRKKSQYASAPEDGWFLELLKCLKN